MYDRILVPTDGSEGTRQTVAEAVELAGLTGAVLYGLYVIDTRDYSTLPESKWFTIEAELRSEGERAIESMAAAAADAAVDITTDITRGVPHEEIIEYAEEHDVDLLVMGTHGRTGLDRFLIGSVTEKVLRSADVPVLVIRIREPDAEDGE